MPIYAYNGVSDRELNATRITSEGKQYTINHPDGLVVDMRFKGTEKSSSNSQGWERSSTYYFKELYKNHPEYFSKKNAARIDRGESPKVDSQFCKAFPQYKQFKNETLIHHHVGKDGQAVAVPQSIHKGPGEIHLVENDLGITDNAKQFSSRCADLCTNHQEAMGKTASYYHDNFTQREDGVEMDSESRGMKLSRTRPVTPEIQDSREKDTAEVLDNYRENLRSHGVSDEKAIEDFTTQEKAKIDEEYASLDRGDEYPHMYQTPTDWESISNSMKGEADQVESTPSMSTNDNAFSAATEPEMDSQTERGSTSENAFTKASEPSNVDSGEGSQEGVSKGNAFSNASNMDMSDGSGSSQEGISSGSGYSSGNSESSTSSSGSSEGYTR